MQLRERVIVGPIKVYTVQSASMYAVLHVVHADKHVARQVL